MLAVLMLGLALLVSSCRPPELSGAVIHYNGKRYNEAYEQAKIAVEKYPDNAEAWYYYGLISGELKKYDEMINAFNKAESLSKQFDVQILNQRNRYFVDTFNAGIKDYQKYPQVKSENPEEAKKVMQEAIQYFTYANQLKTNYNAARMIAICYQILGDNDNAIESYKNLTKTFPDSANAYADLGSLYFYNKDYDNTITQLNKALEKDSTNANALTLLAQTYDFQHQTDKAIETYRKAIRFNPEEKALPFNLGLLLVNATNKNPDLSDDVKNKYLNEAVALFEKVLEMDPDFKEAYQLKGQSELLLEKNEEALKTLQAGVEKFPDDVNMWTNISVAHARLGNKKEAEAAYKKAQELEKN